MWSLGSTLLGDAFTRPRQPAAAARPAVAAPLVPPPTWRSARDAAVPARLRAAPAAPAAPARSGAAPCPHATGAAAAAGLGALHAAVARAPPAAESVQRSSGGGSGAPGPGGGGDGGGDFNTNFGEAVVVLREDLPEMFERDLRWHIYREDVTLTLGSLSGVRLTGLTKYKWLHRSARALAWVLYSDVRLATLRIWESQTERRQLRVRWCVLARPRLALGSGDEPARFEAISTYKFDSRTGRICEHSVDQIIPPESPVARWLEAFVNWQGVGVGAPAQQPGGIPVPGGGGPWRDQL
ncbi:hypothetical protein Rsub_01183 [Raphidocelis subcapitata]|uniref:Uncharacterized protein n=1 Tax=Raphidocelis subcapitata TaxID=307507 RepID=A0A2V0NSC4_9CHLO|nr:hypothetical protein Rsub_01183 [Raphidocelis subcapitata]|eukprot:GBF88470.1 hypothetical protein Rsub_01183 [Raphidocelis subcapitata]